MPLKFLFPAVVAMCLYAVSNTALSSPANAPATEMATNPPAAAEPALDLSSCASLHSSADHELEHSLADFVRLIGDMKKSGGNLDLSRVVNIRLADYYTYLAPLSTYAVPTSLEQSYLTTEFHWESSNWFESENRTVEKTKIVYKTPDSLLSPIREDQRLLARVLDANQNQYSGVCLTQDQISVMQNFVSAQFNPYSVIDKH